MVDREPFGGESAEAGVLAASDAVFHAGVAAVPGVEPGVLPDGGVGGEAGVAPAVAFFDQVQLGAGVRSFAAHDDAHAFGVVGEHCHGEQAGQLGDRGVLARVAVNVEPGVSASVCSRG